MSNSGGQEKMQTFDEAKSSITGTFQSSFASLAKMLGIPQLKESFYQNIIYIFIVIVIMVGILVYIQMVSADNNPIVSNNPLFAPPTKEVKKIEIKRIVEGFSMDETTDISSSAADINDSGMDDSTHEKFDLHEGYVEHESVDSKKKK
jgi:hypothetical protein